MSFTTPLARFTDDERALLDKLDARRGEDPLTLDDLNPDERKVFESLLTFRFVQTCIVAGGVHIGLSVKGIESIRNS